MNYQEAIPVIQQLESVLQKKSATERLAYLYGEYNGRVAFSTSLGAEDQVITQIISQIEPAAYLFTLDTGRLFPESYDLLDVTKRRYGIDIEVFFPDSKSVEEMVNTRGVNLFFESIENRKLCCSVRKIEPLKRALKNMEIWVSGLRKEQSLTRQSHSVVEWDHSHQLIKVNPLLEWTHDNLWTYIKQNNIPYNKLHDQGFTSIGCQPCTRAIEPGEDFRAGRWWWETREAKECGLHK
jgi:phosphoadenosine phosphosulfate reductase